MWILSTVVLVEWVYIIIIPNGFISPPSQLITLASVSLGQMKRETFPKFFSTSFPLARFRLAHTILVLWETAKTFGKAIWHYCWMWPCPRQQDSWESRSASQGPLFFVNETSKVRGSLLYPLFPRIQPEQFCAQPVLRKSPRPWWATSVILEINEGFMREKHSTVSYRQFSVCLPWSSTFVFLCLSFMLVLILLKFYSSHPFSKVQLVIPPPQGSGD